MKKQLILAMLALSAISCHKTHEEPESKWYFQGKVDGVFFKDSTTAAMFSETMAGGAIQQK